MDAKSEHFRFYVFVESKRGQSPQQILQQLRVVFGESAPGSTFVYKWFSEFRSGNRDSAQHLHHPGRPVLQRTDANISRVYDLITEQPKSTLVYLSGELLLSKETVRRILVDDLLFRKVCSTWVPHSLTEENKDQRVQCATNLIHFFALHSMDDLLRLFTVEDETWVPFQACNTKEENKKELRKCNLSCASDAREETLRIFRSIPKERFESELWKLKEHCLLVRSCQGDYVTK